METIATIITIVSLAIHIIQKVNQSSHGTDKKINSYSNATYEIVYEFTVEEKLDNMNIDSLNVCYKTAEINGFSIQKAQQTLLNNYIQTDFHIEDAIICQNCMYLKVKYAIPYNNNNKCYGTSFSINFMTVNNGISVYGSKKTNADEKQVFKQIANELITTLSK